MIYTYIHSITMYDPLKYHGVKEGTCVAIVGCGGLGQMGIKLVCVCVCVWYTSTRMRVRMNWKRRDLIRSLNGTKAFPFQLNVRSNGETEFSVSVHGFFH